MTDETVVPEPAPEDSPVAVEEETSPQEESPKEEDVPKESFLTAEDLTLPEGIAVDDPAVTGFLDTLNATDLSPAERANALLKMHQEALTAAGEAQTQAYLEMQKEWRAQIESDPELGGQNLQATQARIGKVVEQYGDDAFRQAVDLTGVGNHPAFVRFLDRIARDVTEGGPVSGSPASGKSLAEKLYTTMNKE